MDAGSRRFSEGELPAGDGILFSFGDLTGVLRDAGIPLRESLYDGNNPHVRRPCLQGRICFCGRNGPLAISGDEVATALLKLGSGGVRYRCVKMSR